ncbi:hypothetical protein SAMN05216360_11941 [Methylobacterium phyllostachyos]|uniref:Uncharacterized protein n=1 Tax=Methylobacterium phyllostachyos TaxID=582672 RepID=A0A1H0IJ62_9HYPH|nr:hypothetical protein SAMN05216360_11941 [Methylobacterium phyllostachyos]
MERTGQAALEPTSTLRQSRGRFSGVRCGGMACPVLPPCHRRGTRPVGAVSGPVHQPAYAVSGGGSGDCASEARMNAMKNRKYWLTESSSNIIDGMRNRAL